MFDIVISFFENVSPDYIALPFMFLKAEMWDGYIPPPSDNEVVRQIKDRKRNNNGGLVEVQNWDDAKRMLAHGPIECLLDVRDDINLAREPAKPGFLESFFKRPNNDLGMAKIRLLTLQPAFVRLLAPNLSHKPKSDVTSVQEWGLDVEHAMGRFMNKSLERVRKNSYHQQNKAGQSVEDFKDVLETRRVNAVRRALIKMRLNSSAMWPITQGGDHFAQQNPKSVMRVMDFDNRVTHALSVLTQLEESCKDDIAAGKERIKGYEDTQSTISKFYELLETYHDTLDQESGRIRREEAEEFQNGGDTSDKLRAKFRDMSLTMKEDIADRLHALRTSIHVCEIEYGAYQTMIAGEKSSWDSIDHLIRVQIPLFRQQLMQAQNIKAGRVAVQMDNLSAKMQKLSGQKLRDAAAEAIIDGVCEEIKQASDNLDKIAENEIRAITQAQTLMIEDQRPVALLEFKEPELAGVN